MENQVVEHNLASNVMVSFYWVVGAFRPCDGGGGYIISSWEGVLDEF